MGKLQFITVRYDKNSFNSEELDYIVKTTFKLCYILKAIIFRSILNQLLKASEEENKCNFRSSLLK